MMICYHGIPLSGSGQVAAEALCGRDTMASFYAPDQIEVAAEVCRTVVLDNGAFSAWKTGKPVEAWEPYYAWVAHWQRHPSVGWAVIPDIIDGSERDNESLISRWPRNLVGIPVWHLHEPLQRLKFMITRPIFPAVAIGSSGQYAEAGTKKWWGRIAEVMAAVCDVDGYPKKPLHGLRMLDPTILAHLPLASADSTNVARNIAYDARWGGPYAPKSKALRARIIMDRIESHAKAHRWCGSAGQQRNFELLDYA